MDEKRVYKLWLHGYNGPHVLDSIEAVTEEVAALLREGDLNPITVTPTNMTETELAGLPEFTGY